MADLPDNQPVEQPEVSAEPPVEQQEELTPEEEALASPQGPEKPENPEAPAEPETLEEKPPSRREQLRVQQLLKKYGPPPERVPKQVTRPDFRNKVDADEQVYKDLEDTAVQYGTSLVDSALNQANYQTWHRFLKMDDAQVRGKFGVLDPSNKEKFHPALADALNTRYLSFIGFDPGDASRGIPPTVQKPDVSYLDFVEAEMEFADEIAAHRVANSTQNIARQAANAGLRPDGSSAKPLNLNKAPEDMTDDELRAAAKASMPRDSRGRFTS